MLAFPQLLTGASALYPVRKTLVQRTVVNTLDGGDTDVYIDPQGAFTVWEFAGPGFTRAEWDAIEVFFEQAAGMYSTFTLLDPVGNLLAQSEALGNAVWTADTSITLTAGISDPLGTARATQITNSGVSAQQIGQTPTCPGNYHYCFSAWLRSDTAATVTLAIDAGTAELGQTVTLSSQWQRFFVSGSPNQPGVTSVAFELRLGASDTVDVFGLQAEPQLAPSDYKMTGTRGGVYTKARFASDQITGRAQSVDVHDSVIRIVSTEN